MQSATRPHVVQNFIITWHGKRIVYRNEFQRCFSWRRIPHIATARQVSLHLKRSPYTHTVLASQMKTCHYTTWIHRGPVNSPHKWPVTRKMFPFDDVIMSRSSYMGNISARMVQLLSMSSALLSTPRGLIRTHNSTYRWLSTKHVVSSVC